MGTHDQTPEQFWGEPKVRGDTAMAHRIILFSLFRLKVPEHPKEGYIVEAEIPNRLMQPVRAIVAMNGLLMVSESQLNNGVVVAKFRTVQASHVALLN